MNARALTTFACAIAALASLGSVPAAAGERLDNIVKNLQVVKRSLKAQKRSRHFS